MANELYTVQEQSLTDIALATRVKGNTSELMQVTEMPQRIRDIIGGGAGGATIINGQPAEIIHARGFNLYPTVANTSNIIWGSTESDKNEGVWAVKTMADKANSRAWLCVGPVDLSKYSYIHANFFKQEYENIHVRLFTSDQNTYSGVSKQAWGIPTGGYTSTTELGVNGDVDITHEIGHHKNFAAAAYSIALALHNPDPTHQYIWWGFDTNNASWDNHRHYFYFISLWGILK